MADHRRFGMYSYRTTSRLVVGCDARLELGAIVSRLRGTRALVICNPSIARRESLMTELLGGIAELAAEPFTGVEPNSPREVVERVTTLIRESRPDIVIVVGSGSAAVTARAAITLAGEDRGLEELATHYRLNGTPVSPRLTHTKVPHVVLPTTPSTAFVSAGEAIVDRGTAHRWELFDPRSRPSAVLVDPVLLSTAPAERVRGSAIATLCLAISLREAPSVETNALARADLHEAIRLLGRFLPRLNSSPGDPDVRLPLAEAALLVCRARNAHIEPGNGLAVGLAHQMVLRYGIEGAAASILPAALKFNRPTSERAQAELVRLLDRREGPDWSLADDAPAVVASFLYACGAPRGGLQALGIPLSELAGVTEGAMSDYYVRSNVRPVENGHQLQTILQDAWRSA